MTPDQIAQQALTAAWVSAGAAVAQAIGAVAAIGASVWLAWAADRRSRQAAAESVAREHAAEAASVKRQEMAEAAAADRAERARAAAAGAEKVRVTRLLEVAGASGMSLVTHLRPALEELRSGEMNESRFLAFWGGHAAVAVPTLQDVARLLGENGPLTFELLNAARLIEAQDLTGLSVAQLIELHEPRLDLIEGAMKRIMQPSRL